MIAQQFPALLVVIPLLAAPLTVLLNQKTLAWLITALMSAACLYMSIHVAWDVFYGSTIYYEMGGWAPPWGISYQIDALNALVAVIISLIGGATLMFARKSVEQEIPDHLIPLFYATFQLCFLGLMGIALTGDIFNLFVFLEISSLSSYALIAIGRKRKALTASFHYLVLGTLGANLLPDWCWFRLCRYRHLEYVRPVRQAGDTGQPAATAYRVCVYRCRHSPESGDLSRAPVAT